MASTFTREAILDRLNKTIAEGKPILGAGCSAGIIAKCAELGGADLILVYSTGVSRLKGLPTSRMGDNNGLTLEMAPEILWRRRTLRSSPAVKQTIRSAWIKSGCLTCSSMLVFMASSPSPR